MLPAIDRFYVSVVKCVTLPEGGYELTLHVRKAAAKGDGEREARPNEDAKEGGLQE